MDTPDCPVDVSKAVHALLGIPLPKVPTGTQPVKPRADRYSTGFAGGPTLKTLQRFGTFGRRSNGPDPTSLSSGTADRKAKQAKYMYLSIDEAATHVGNKRFRLVAMVYEQNGQDLIGTTCSQPIRVMANNDVPIGAAHIRLSCNIRSSDCLPYSPLVVPKLCKFGKAYALSRMLW
ncbi:TPA: hypothetical protein ACH3X1_008208 [Trebouxia sp. C0004]